MNLQYILQQLPEEMELEGNIMENTIRINGKKIPLSKSLKVRNHSPTGFNWGYGGSGPAQTALAILLEFMPNEAAVEFYQAFKFHFVAGLPRTDFKTKVNLRQTMNEIFQKHPSLLKTGNLF